MALCVVFQLSVGSYCNLMPISWSSLLEQWNLQVVTQKNTLHDIRWSKKLGKSKYGRKQAANVMAQQR